MWETDSEAEDIFIWLVRPNRSVNPTLATL